jgi:hypothetical protein
MAVTGIYIFVTVLKGLFRTAPSSFYPLRVIVADYHLLLYIFQLFKNPLLVTRY